VPLTPTFVNKAKLASEVACKDVVTVGVVSTGLVRVLFVRVWVWASKTNVSLVVNAGRVIPRFATRLLGVTVYVYVCDRSRRVTPDISGLVIVGAVRVLFWNVCIPAKLAIVPEVGNVIVVLPLRVMARLYAPPDVDTAPARVRFPPRSIVRSALLRSKLRVLVAEKAPSEDANVRYRVLLSTIDNAEAPVIVGEVIVGEVSVLLVSVWVADVPTKDCVAFVGNDRVMLDEGLPAERIVAFPACLREIVLPSNSRVPAILMPYASERKSGGRNPPTNVIEYQLPS
jgi:hypothetical protein